MKRNAASRLLCWLDKHTEETILFICLVVITVLTFTNVIMRYVFSKSLTWSEEICKLCLVTSGFYSIGYCIRFKKMIRVDAVVQLFGERASKILEFLSWVFMFVFLIFLAKGGINVINNARNTMQINPALQIPIYITYIVPLSGFVLALIRVVQLFYFEVRKILGIHIEEKGE